jgi:LPS export ABC transporter protein LptC
MNQWLGIRKTLPFVSGAVRLMLLVALLLSVSACGKKNQPPENQVVQEPSPTSEFDENLTFNNVSLDQSDRDGRPVWKVKAERAVYSQDKKIARVEKASGNLFQDGKVVLQVSADRGEIQEDGQKVFLNGNVTAIDPRNGAVFKGDELEWLPKEDLLFVRNNLKGSHPQLQASAKEGRYLTRKQQLELMGQVAAIAKNPDLQIKTERLVWQIPEEQVTSDRRTFIDRYQGKTITDRVEADQANYNLKTKIATLKQNVQLASVEPPLLMSTNSAIWNVTNQTVVSSQPIRIVHQKEQLIVTANRGQIDLDRQVATLTGGVQGIGSRNQAKLYSNQLTWDLTTQNLQASGNVMYEQANPALNTKGQTAVGRIQDQSVVVQASSGNRVVTEIFP